MKLLVEMTDAEYKRYEAGAFRKEEASKEDKEFYENVVGWMEESNVRGQIRLLGLPDVMEVLREGEWGETYTQVKKLHLGEGDVLVVKTDLDFYDDDEAKALAHSIKERVGCKGVVLVDRDDDVSVQKTGE